MCEKRMCLYAHTYHPTNMTRKLRNPPPMPEDPIERLEEVKSFRRLLANDFYDYGYTDVYDSVFHSRVHTFLEHVNFHPDDMSPEERAQFTPEQIQLSMKIYLLGTEIQETNSTSVLMFIQFFGAIMDFMNSVQ